MKFEINASKLFSMEFVKDAALMVAGILIAHEMGYKYGCKVTRKNDLKAFYHFDPEVASEFMKHCSEMYIKHNK